MAQIRIAHLFQADFLYPVFDQGVDSSQDVHTMGQTTLVFEQSITTQAHFQVGRQSQIVGCWFCVRNWSRNTVSVKSIDRIRRSRWIVWIHSHVGWWKSNIEVCGQTRNWAWKPNPEANRELKIYRGSETTSRGSTRPNFPQETFSGAALRTTPPTPAHDARYAKTGFAEVPVQVQVRCTHTHNRAATNNVRIVSIISLLETHHTRHKRRKLGTSTKTNSRHDIYFFGFL